METRRAAGVTRASRRWTRASGDQAWPAGESARKICANLQLVYTGLHMIYIGSRSRKICANLRLVYTGFTPDLYLGSGVDDDSRSRKTAREFTPGLHLVYTWLRLVREAENIRSEIRSVRGV